MNAQVEEGAPPKAPKKTEYEKVTMEDGSVEEFPVSTSGKRERMLNKSWSADDAGNVNVRLAFRNGRLINHLISANDPLRAQYIGHGAEQKLGDETAGAESIDDAIEWVENLVDLLKQGKWSTGRAPGSGEVGVSVLAQAILQMREEAGKPLTREQVREYLRGKTHKEKMVLRANPKIAQIVKRIEAEAGKLDPEASARLAEEIDSL